MAIHSLSCVPPQLQKVGAAFPKSPSSALPVLGHNCERAPGGIKQWQLMTNGLSWPPSPSPLFVTMETPVSRTRRSGNIHQGQSGGHRCLESQYANEILQSTEGETGNLNQGAETGFLSGTVTLSFISSPGVMSF